MKLYREIEKIMPIIEDSLTAESFEEFKYTRVSDLCFYHFGLGTFIRNNFSYNKDSILLDLFLEHGVTDEDEMSAFIIRVFHYHSTKYDEISKVRNPYSY